MAAGSFVPYSSFIQKLGQETLDLETDTLCFALVGTGYTPADSHSDYSAQVSAQELSTASSSGVRTLAGVVWTASGSTAWRLAANNYTFTAGNTVTAKYAVVYTQSAKELVAYCDLNTAGAASAVEATQITVQFNGGGSAGTILKVYRG